MPSKQAGRVILVIDDQEAVCETVAMILRSQGYIAYTENDGLDALRRLRYTRVDLVITDLNMPGISGFDVIAAIRSWYPTMPLVAMSGAYEAGCVPPDIAFYSKGEGPEQLLSIVEQMFSGQVNLNEARNAYQETPKA
jgi:CheY-like chemotaxis protein